MVKPHVLAVLPEYSPSTVINIATPLKAMMDLGLIDLVVQMQNEVTPSAVAQADVMVLCRNWEPVYRPIFELALSLNIPIVYDLDDHVLIAPHGGHTYQLFQSPRRRETFEWLLRQAALVRVHSPTLQEVIRAYNPNTELVWAAVDWSLVPLELPHLALEPVHIVYAAQRDSARMLYPLMRDDLHRTLAVFGERVRLHFLGYAPSDLESHPLVTCHPFESDYASFFSSFTRFGYTIGLAPMINDLFHNCKTNIKYRDYAAAGAAGIYTDTPLYRENGVVDGQTGLLVSGEPGSWFVAIQRLIEDPRLIEFIRHNAREQVFARYHIDVVSKMWMAHFLALPTRPLIVSSEHERLAALRWAFTHVRNPDTPVVAVLRGILRKTVPVKWRLFYHYLIMLFRKILFKIINKI